MEQDFLENLTNIYVQFDDIVGKEFVNFVERYLSYRHLDDGQLNFYY